MRHKKNFKYIYGPVFSWRLGRSLGIDPISKEEGKVCSFDCIYCQIGKTFSFAKKRKIFIPTKKIIAEIKSLPLLKIDYFTFSGRGEPTLAKNLGELIKAIKKIRKEKIAILTNSSLIYRRDVQRDLLLADFVIAKLDACSQNLFKKINQPVKNLKCKEIVKGIKEFKSKYKGRLALQIMFIKENKKEARKIARIAKEIGPDEIQINTPLRPSQAKPLSKREILAIKRHFTRLAARLEDLPIISVYESRKKKTKPISIEEVVKRRGEA